MYQLHLTIEREFQVSCRKRVLEYGFAKDRLHTPVLDFNHPQIRVTLYGTPDIAVGFRLKDQVILKRIDPDKPSGQVAFLPQQSALAGKIVDLLQNHSTRAIPARQNVDANS